MNYIQLSKEERFFISKHYTKGTLQEIANMLSRSKSTISRELKRNSVDEIYDPREAQEKFVKRSYNKHSMKLSKYYEFNLLFKQYFDKRSCGAETTWLQIKKWAKEKEWTFKIPSLSTVYYWINSGRWIISRKDTLRSAYKKGGKRIGGYFTHGNNKYVLPLGRRPKHILNRQEFGHGEVDLVVGGKKKGHSSLLVLTERKTRKEFIRRVWSKNPWHINKVLDALIRNNRIPIRTLTMDNGYEFNNLGLLAKKHKFKAYICEPYASHQRGTNERINGDIRRGYPKGTDFNGIDNYAIAKLEEDINCMRRHIFNLDTAESKYGEEYKIFQQQTNPNGFFRKDKFKPFEYFEEKSYVYRT